jgi:hypothetical protein
MARAVAFALIVVAVVLGVLLVDTHEPPSVEPPAAREPALRARDGKGGVPETRPVVAVRIPVEARAVSSPAPHRGVRGVVVSSRVQLADGSDGVDPDAWEADVYALVLSRERRVLDRIGIATSRRPLSDRGDFEIDLPTGRHLIVIRHQVGSAQARVLEAWYGYADITESQSTPVDFGRREFARGAIEGVLLGENGDACGQQEVAFSDEEKDPGDPLVRGVHLGTLTSAEGRFAFSVAREDRTAVVARVFAHVNGAQAERRDVRHGEFIELVLRKQEPEADVTFEVPWSAGMTFWVYSLDRRLAFMREGGKAPEGRVVEERRALPPGRYVVEVLREADSPEWARKEFELTSAAPKRIRVEPVFQPARTITGSASPAATVAWVTRIRDGSSFVRRTANADSDGRFVLRGIPTLEVHLQIGSVLTRVPRGTDAVLDVGQLMAR